MKSLINYMRICRPRTFSYLNISRNSTYKGNCRLANYRKLSGNRAHTKNIYAVQASDHHQPHLLKQMRWVGGGLTVVRHTTFTAKYSLRQAKLALGNQLSLCPYALFRKSPYNSTAVLFRLEDDPFRGHQ